MPKREWERVGQVAVDAGQIIVCDPCHIYEPESAVQRAVGGSGSDDYYAYLKRSGFFAERRVTQQIGVDAGVVVTSGYGDGVYDVFVARTTDGRVAELKVVFIDD